MDFEGAARQGCPVEVLGDVVPTVPKGNARPRSALSAIQGSRPPDPGHLRRRRRQSETLYRAAEGHLPHPARSRTKSERTLPDRGNSQNIRLRSQRKTGREVDRHPNAKAILGKTA